MPNPEELPSSRDLKDCHPYLQDRWDWIRNMYHHLFPDDAQPLISQTFRSKADQDKQVFEGDSKVLWPMSTHNYTQEGKPCSLALDFYFNVDGKTVYTRGWMERVIHLAGLVGLFSGSSWGWDYPHLALVERLSDWGDTALLTDIPEFPFGAKVADSATIQPIIRYHDGVGTPTVWRGEGDLLIRVSHNQFRDDRLVLDIRYDKKEK